MEEIVSMTPATGRLVTYLQLFDRSVSQRANELAACDEARQVTYVQLQAIANRFAWELQRLGVRRREVVAIARDRDVPTLAAILAIFRCGAAYLPLDPALPPERSRRMLERCSCRLVLAGPTATAALRGAGCTAIAMADPQAWLDDPAPAPHVRTEGELDDPAYVIFTSGSTGEPKGAMLSQANMVNHLWAKIEDLGLEPDDRIAHTAPFSFDLSVWQYLVAGVLGASVTVVPRDTVMDPQALMDLLAREKITVLELVPSQLSVLLDVAASRRRAVCGSLRVMVTAGEALPANLARRWFAQSKATLVNAYGPTECGVDVTHHVMHAPPGGDMVPIGKAIRGALLHVVDADLHPVPDGDSGELLIGGCPTGLGYIQAPEQTARAFVNPPHLDGRYYRSGDKVRRRDGVYEFFGRLDLQIKLRGHRIEPEEIESVLLSDARVRAAAVVLHRDGERAELVAVVQPSERTDDPHALAPALRDRLAAALPSYMVPPAIEFIHTLPVNSRGKVDREAVGRFVCTLNPFR